MGILRGVRNFGVNSDTTTCLVSHRLYIHSLQKFATGEKYEDYFSLFMDNARRFKFSRKRSRAWLKFRHWFKFTEFEN